MAILKQVNPPAGHRCSKPSNPAASYGVGTVYECDDCGKQYKLTIDRDGEWIWADLLPEKYLPSEKFPNSKV